MNSNVPQEQMRTNDNSNGMESNLKESMDVKDSTEEAQDSNSLFNHILQEDKI